MTNAKIYLYTGRDMPRRSRVELSPETISELENQFYDFLNSLSYDEKKKFFAEFLTDEEKMMMYKRLALYWSLLEGFPLARIQQMIGVTHDTTRVYNKRKNTLSEEFKGLIKRVGSKMDRQAPETPQQEAQPSFEQTQAPQAESPEPQMQMESPTEPETSTTESTEIVHSLDMEPTQIEEPTEQAHTEATVQPPSHDEWIEASETHETKQESDHTMESQFGMPDMPKMESTESKDEDKPVMESLEHTTPNEEKNAWDQPSEHKPMEPQSEQTEQQPQMQTEQRENGEKSDDEEDGEGEKKKGGWGKFFGF